MTMNQESKNMLNPSLNFLAGGSERLLKDVWDPVRTLFSLLLPKSLYMIAPPLTERKHSAALLLCTIL